MKTNIFDWKGMFLGPPLTGISCFSGGWLVGCFAELRSEEHLIWLDKRNIVRKAWVGKWRSFCMKRGMRSWDFNPSIRDCLGWKPGLQGDKHVPLTMQSQMLPMQWVCMKCHPAKTHKHTHLHTHYIHRHHWHWCLPHLWQHLFTLSPVLIDTVAIAGCITGW